MRPQHITAENVAPWVAAFRTIAASMRPQHITAENGKVVVRVGGAVLLQ